MKRFFLFIVALIFLSSCMSHVTSLPKDFLYETYDWKRSSTGADLGNMFLSVLAGTALTPFKRGQCLDATVEEMRELVIYDALSSGKMVTWQRDVNTHPLIIIIANPLPLEPFFPGDDRRFLISLTTVVTGAFSGKTSLTEHIVIKKKGQMILIWRQPMMLSKDSDQAAIQAAQAAMKEFWEKVAANDESNYKPLLPSKKCK